MKSMFFMRIILLLGLSLGHAFELMAQESEQNITLETDVSLVNSDLKEVTLKPLEDEKSDKEKIHIPWEKLGPGKIQDLVKKLSEKKGKSGSNDSWLAAWSVGYLYRYLMKIAIGIHDQSVVDPYSLNESTEGKLADSQMYLMGEYTKILSNPDFMARFYNEDGNLSADFSGDKGQLFQQRIEQMAMSDMARLFTPEESADLLIYELSKMPFFPKTPTEYEAFKKMAIKWGALPVGAIVLGDKLGSNKLAGKIYLPVFILPSGHLGLILNASVDHLGIALSPRMMGQGELILMRFKIKGKIEEQRGTMFSPGTRNLNVELSEDWSGLMLKKFGINSHFYFKAKRQLDLKAATNQDILEAGLEINSEKAGKLFNIISYTNFHANLSFDSDNNLKSRFQLNRAMEKYLFTLDLQGQYNFKSQEFTVSGNSLLQRPLNDRLNLAAGLQFDKSKNGGALTSYVGITEESRNLSARLQLMMKDNGPIKPSVSNNPNDQFVWNVGIGIAGQLENQKNADMKYLSHLDFKIRDSMRLYEQYEKELQKNFQILINDEAIWSDDSKGQADFNQKFQYLITPLLFSLSSVGKDVENKFNEFPHLQTEYKRKYKEAAFQGEVSEPETAKLVSELIERNRSLEARGSENIKSETIFLSLAHFFKAM